MDTFTPDDTCCGAALHAAALAGLLESVDEWECPECGVKWKPRQIHGLRHWEPVEWLARL